MRHKRRWILGGAAIMVIVLGGAYWYLFGGSEPAEVALASPSPGGAAQSGSTVSFDGSFDGTWTIDTESGSFEDFTSTFAGYRVEEELGGVGANTAVGRTPDVSGSLQIEGTTITAVSVEVDMTTLTSDEARRDNSLGTRGLETQSFPTATFELTEPIEVGKTPEQGEILEVEAIGELTLHGVTREVTVPIQGRWTGERIEVVASIEVALADYDIEPPTGFLVLSIADVGTVELNLLFQKAS
jgi:polyisoprenoid-binding protein YceI